MQIWRRCPNGRRRDGSPCIFCTDGSYCSHQEYSQITRRYETVGHERCKKNGGHWPYPEKKPLLKIDDLRVQGRELQFLLEGEVMRSVMLPAVVSQGEDAATDEELNEMLTDIFSDHI